MILVGMDPGQAGAVAVYDTTTGELNVYDMPTQARGTKGKLVMDVHELHALLSAYKDMGAQWCFVEQVGGMPGQSAPAAFNFGEGYGCICTVALLLGYKLERVPAATWKIAMRVPADKKAAITRASELIPTHKHLWSKHGTGNSQTGAIAQRSGRAEAAMLVLYAERLLKAGRTQ